MGKKLANKTVDALWSGNQVLMENKQVNKEGIEIDKEKRNKFLHKTRLCYRADFENLDGRCLGNKKKLERKEMKWNMVDVI